MCANSVRPRARSIGLWRHCVARRLRHEPAYVAVVGVSGIKVVAEVSPGAWTTAVPVRIRRCYGMLSLHKGCTPAAGTVAIT